MKNYASHFPIHYACQLNNVDTVKKYLEKNPTKVDLKDHKLHTLLHVACVYDQVECAQLLLEHGANVHFKDKSIPSDYSLIHYMSSGGHYEIVELLIRFGANVLAKTKVMKYDLDDGKILSYGNKSPLHLACDFGKDDCVALLLDNGAGACIRDLDSLGNTPLKCACYSKSIDCVLEILEFFNDLTLITPEIKKDMKEYSEPIQDLLKSWKPAE